MNGTVLTRLLRQAVRTAVALCAGTFAFFYLVLTASSSCLSEATFDVPFLRDPPRAMQALFGGSVDFLHAEGWLVTALAHPITLALFTAAALTVPAVIATEVERGIPGRQGAGLHLTVGDLIVPSVIGVIALLAAVLSFSRRDIVR